MLLPCKDTIFPLFHDIVVIVVHLIIGPAQMEINVNAVEDNRNGTMLDKHIRMSTTDRDNYIII